MFKGLAQSIEEMAERQRIVDQRLVNENIKTFKELLSGTSNIDVCFRETVVRSLSSGSVQSQNIHE